MGEDASGKKLGLVDWACCRDDYGNKSWLGTVDVIDTHKIKHGLCEFELLLGMSCLWWCGVTNFMVESVWCQVNWAVLGVAGVIDSEKWIGTLGVLWHHFLGTCILRHETK